MDKIHQIPVEEIRLKPICDIQREEIDDQIRVRKHLISHVLIGSLYPGILRREISELELEKNLKNP